TIQNDDTPPPPTLAIAATDAEKAEGDSGTTAFTFTVTRSGDTTGATDVDYAISGDADATDFGGTLPSGTVNFAAGETSKEITVNVSGDTNFETDENFTVTLSNATGGATISTGTADGTIQNDDTDTVISGTNNTLYDGTKGVTPNNANATDNGQWLEHLNLLTDPAVLPNPSPVQDETITANATQLNTAGDNTIVAGYSNYHDHDLNPATPTALVNSSFPTLDNSQGYMVNFTIQVNSETNNGDDYNSDGKLDRAGFSVIAVSNNNEKAIELSFESGRIWAQDVTGTATTDLLQAEGVSLDTTQKRDYNVKVSGDTYTLFADDTPILSGDLRDYTGVNLGNLPNPYQTANGIFLGDRNDDAGAQVDIYDVSVTTPTAESSEQVEFDFNGDSKADILWRNDTTGENQIWATNPTNIQGLPNRSSDWSIPQIGNFDNDISIEILWRNTSSGENQIWDIDGTTQVSGLPTRSSQWQPLQVGDFDGDNIDELLWRNTSSGVNQLWDVDGTTQVSGLLTRNSNWTPVAVGDFDGDNIDELLWRNNSTGQNQIWNVDGTIQVQGLPNRNSNWEVAQVGDFDGDNIDELLWRNNSSGQNQIWDVDGTTQTQGLPNRSSNWEVVQVGDFDGDNIDELLWRNNSSGQNQIWDVDGTAQTQGLPNRSSNWEVAQVGDFDSDNIDELLWRNNSTGENQLWNVDGTVGISGISSQGVNWQVI
ncbi:MAG: hypothetical protein F6K40_25815, partial [Okeania sp. SIO3I5]|uniref:choice-of-anchor Y domain-containing protein n=1 Tax=Okeania sp. SIO3I5 TaxID=2607805 RepID=UPI0013BE656C